MVYSLKDIKQREEWLYSSDCFEKMRDRSDCLSMSVKYKLKCKPANLPSFSLLEVSQSPLQPPVMKPDKQYCYLET